METFTTNIQTMKAEIIWVLKTVVSGLSHSSNNDISNFFRAMFPNNATAQQFSLGRAKSIYIVNHDLSPYFKELLTESVNLSDCFVISFDESFDSVTQSCEMDIIILFWDIQAQIVRVCYWGSEFLGHTTNKNLLNKIENGTSMLNMKNLKQISMDGPNMNRKFFECFVSKRESEKLPGLIHIGSCNLHVLNNAFKTGANAIGWNLHKLMEACFQILHDSPVRKEDYITIIDSIKF